jgi:hypothetical protein
MAAGPDQPEPDATDPAAGGASTGRWTTVAAVLLGVPAVAQIAYGAAAIAGDASLQANIHQIESNPQFGTLFLSLTGWGVVLALVGAFGFVAAWSLKSRASHARLFALGAVLFGLAAAFFTLAIFHAAALVTLGFQFAALYVLSYRVAG